MLDRDSKVTTEHREGGTKLHFICNFGVSLDRNLNTALNQTKLPFSELREIKDFCS